MAIKTVGIPPELGRLLQRIADGQDAPDETETVLSEVESGGKEYPTNIPMDARIMRLKEYANHRKAAMNRPVYNIGDIVSPRAGHGIRGVGHPHVVMDIVKDAQPQFNPGNPDNAANGPRLDMRVAVMATNNLMLCFWVESMNYDPFED